MPFFLCSPHGHEAHHIDLLEHKALFDALMEDKSINVEFKICYGWPVIDHCNYTCVITL